MAGESLKDVVNQPAEENAPTKISNFPSKGDHRLADALKGIREATDALVPEYHILDLHRRLPSEEAEGILWGLSLLVEQLEFALDGLQAAVVDGSMTAEQALQLAKEQVLTAVRELRFGARLRPRRFYSRAALPPVAELGRLSAIVRRLADSLAEISEDGGIHRPPRPQTLRVEIHPAP